MAEYILGFVVILQFIYIIYKDREERAEREKLQMKLMSKDVEEYKRAVDPAPKDAEEKKSPYVDLDDVPIDKLMRAEDRI